MTIDFLLAITAELSYLRRYALQHAANRAFRQVSSVPPTLFAAAVYIRRFVPQTIVVGSTKLMTGFMQQSELVLSINSILLFVTESRSFSHHSRHNTYYVMENAVAILLNTERALIARTGDISCPEILGCRFSTNPLGSDEMEVKSLAGVVFIGSYTEMFFSMAIVPC